VGSPGGGSIQGSLVVVPWSVLVNWGSMKGSPVGVTGKVIWMVSPVGSHGGVRWT
jgi:hypothetical protein